MKTLTTIFASLFIASAACATEQHGKPGSDDRKTTQTTNVMQSARSESSAQSRASAKSRAMANSSATGGNGTGGNAEAAGGSANATGGQVIVNAGGAGSGLHGRMVPDVAAGAPITSTSCRNGISAGGSGNGWVDCSGSSPRTICANGACSRLATGPPASSTRPTPSAPG